MKNKHKMFDFVYRCMVIFSYEGSLDRDLLFKVDSEPLQTPKPEVAIEPASC